MGILQQIISALTAIVMALSAQIASLPAQPTDVNKGGSVLGASTTGLVGYWKLDENIGTTVEDSSGNDKSLNLSGTNWDVGNVGFALKFDGSNQNAINSNFNSITDFPFTLSAWTANTGSNGSFKPAVALGKNGNEYFGIGWNTSSDANRVFIVGRNTTFDPYGNSTIVPPNTWTHIVGVFESPTKRTLYVNGVLVGSDTSLVDFPTGSNIINLGATPTSAGSCNCLVDEVMVYNRGLSGEEVMDVFNNNPLPSADVLSPKISNVQISAMTENSSTISWTTNELSDTQVEYGTTLSYGNLSVKNTTQSLNHSITLTDLTPSSLYHFRAKSSDSSGNIGFSSDTTFTTAEADSSSVVFPPTTTSAPSGNGITIKDLSASNQINRPYTFSRIFKQGEITNFPQARVAGTLIPTQADVKNRWPDGSVKQSIISFVTSIPANQAIFVDFVNQSGCNCGNGLTKAQMLSADYNFDATMEFTPGGSVSARQILQDWSGVDTGVNGQGVRLWMNGPIATQVILEDRTTALKYDLSYNGYKSLHPYFIVTFYHGTKEVKVEYIAENVWVKAMQDLNYSVSLKAKGTEKYRKDGVLHYGGSRWRKIFWMGTEAPRVNIDHNFPYMISTMAIPNYDRSITLSQFGLDVEINQFNASDKGDIMGTTMTGNGDTFIDKSFQDGIEEGGMLPRADTKYLYTFDPRLHDVLFGDTVPGGGGLMAVWSHIPTHFRESDETYKYQDTNDDGVADFGQAFGKPLSIDARVSAQLKMVYSDRVGLPAPVGPMVNGGGWNVDMAHQNNRQYLGYMLTGDYYYLEEMMFWSSTNLLASGAGKGAPTGGVNSSRWANWGIFAESHQTRAVAHAIRILGQLVFMMPDSLETKSYFNKKLTNNLTVWEGAYGITDGAFYSPCTTSPYDYKTEKSKWCWGKYHVGGDKLSPEKNPLRLVALGRGDPVKLVGGPSEIDVNKVSAVGGALEWNYMGLTFSHLYELGFNTRKIQEFIAYHFINKVLNPQFNPYKTDTYVIPVRQRPDLTDTDTKDDPLFTTWKDFREAFTNPDNNSFSSARRNSNGRNDYYAFEYIGVLSFFSDIFAGPYSGQLAYNWYRNNFPYYSDFTVQPKWAFAPRVIGSTTPPPPTSDTTAPSIPTNLSATAISSSQVNLTWTASTDNVGVSGYKIYRGGVQIGTATTNSYSNNGLSASTAYNYTVSAYDTAGNNSAQTASVSATTKAPGVVVPVISNLVGSNTTSTTTKISWNTNIATNGQVFYGTTASYGLSSSLINNSTKTTSHSVTLSDLFPSTLYHFRVTSIDANNNSTVSSDFTFTTSASASSGGNGTAGGGTTDGGSTTGGTISESATVYIPPQNIVIDASIATCTSIQKLTRNLYKSLKGDDVITLQNFLISQNLLASDSNTGYFGPLTEKAVQAFQKAQNIVSSGNFWSTGYGMIGPTTRAKINSLLSNTSCQSTTGSGQTNIQSLQEQIKMLQAQVNALLLKLQQMR